MTVVYYPGWGIYGRNHFINDIDFNDVTEISYAFFDVEPNGDLRTIDPYEWSDKAFTASESVSGVADTWEPGSARGNQNQFAQLAQEHPDVGINIALGGWTLSDEFSTAVLDPTGTPLPADQAQQNLDAQAAETDFGVGDGEDPGDDMPDMDGDPMDGEPMDGDPMDGETMDGDPMDGDPMDGEPTDGDPMDGGHMGGDPMNGGGHDMPMPTGDGSGANNPEITAQNATHVISWAWGQNTTDTDFDPTTDTLFFNWMSADNVEVTQTAAGVVIALPANQQSLTLAGLALADMGLSNIHALDPGLRDELAGLIADKSAGGGMGDDHDHGDGGDHDHGGMTGTMTMVTLTSADQIIADFNAATDMVHIEDGITADRLQIFEESGDALGLTTRIVVLDDGGDILSTTIVQGVGLSDLTLANFSIAEQSAQNEVAAAIGQTISAPTSGTGGYDVVYDSDGSNPAGTTGASPQGGIKYRGEINADDVVGFNIALDQIDVGGTSVHGLIFTKTPSGEFAIDSPWTDAIQIFQGVQMADLTLANFAVVGNEHLRQDVGGVMSWELGVGPRESDTVYIRSHEYGVHEVVDGFDPASMKISFLYFGTRERLMVEDTDEGLKIWSMPTGQSMTFTDVTKADLIPGLIEFHHDQIIEDNLETPFGMAAGDLTLVDRTVILTPDGPPGATTDGFQTQIGDLTGATVDVGEPIDAGGGGGGVEPPDTGGSQSGSIAGFTPVDFANGQPDTVALTWAWATKTAVTGFEPETDHFDFGGMSEEFVDVWEDGGNLYFEVIGNGGNITALVDIQAEDLSASTLKAAGWNDVLDADSSVIQSLVNLGLDFG